MKVALVHDYLREYGGAERVLEALHEIYPEAPLFTAYYNPEGLGIHAKNFSSWNIKTSWMQNLPFANKLRSPLRFLAPSVFESFDLSEFDLIISSCNTYFSKAVKVKPGAYHLSYIHTPPRYLYGFTTSFNYKKHWWTRVAAEIINHFLRLADFQTSQRPDVLIANSKNVADRIKKFYRRESVVIYPPVDIVKLKSQIAKRKTTTQNAKLYYLSVSRLVRGKGVDIIVEACTKLNLPLKVVGTGPELENLQQITKTHPSSGGHESRITFLGEVKDEELGELYANAKALIVASEDEDFGITAVEAQAAGTPVIAVRAGGYLETVIEGKTGIFFDEASVESLMEALQKFNEQKFKEEDLRKNAERFSKERFKEEITDLVKKNL